MPGRWHVALPDFQTLLEQMGHHILSAVTAATGWVVVNRHREPKGDGAGSGGWGLDGAGVFCRQGHILPRSCSLPTSIARASTKGPGGHFVAQGTTWLTLSPSLVPWAGKCCRILFNSYANSAPLELFPALCMCRLKPGSSPGRGSGCPGPTGWVGLVV